MPIQMFIGKQEYLVMVYLLIELNSMWTRFQKKIMFVGLQFTNAQHAMSKQQQLKRLNKSLCQA